MKLQRTSRVLLVLSIAVLGAVGCAKVSMKEARKAYSDKQFVTAAEMFGKVASKSSKGNETNEQKAEKLEAMYLAAESYRNANDYRNAEKWYEKTIKKDKNNDDAVFKLAAIYQRQNQYREAIEQYTNYLNLKPGSEEAIVRKEFCEKALALSEDSSRFTVTNFKIANTKTSDFSPMIASKKDDKLYFTSDRITKGPSKKREFEWTGRGYTDLYEVTFEGKRNRKKWQKPVILDGPINTKHNDGVCAFDRRFSTMYFTICNAKDPENKKKENFDCKIYMSRKQGMSWSDPEILPFCKDDTFTYGHPTLNEDNTKLYFSSDRDGGFGGHDIYVSNFVRKGRTWSEPVNLGKEINTKGDEVFPYWNNHDNKLYFSSNGLPGLGGLDIFRTEGSGTEWSEPENLLKPMNSGGDDFGITFDFTRDDHGFFTSDRDGGRGSDDIYEFDIKPLIFTLAGQVTDCNSSKPLANATIHLSNGNDTAKLHLKTDEFGYYKVELSAETAYDFYATDKPDRYFDSREYGVSTKGLEVSKDFIQDICLENPFDKIKTYPIYYDLDKDFIRPDAALELDKLYNDVLAKYPYVTIELGSHTDCRSSYEYNEDLSQRRAKSAVAYLVKKGVDPNRILAKGYGESELVNHCACEGTEKVECSEAEHQANRRTTVKVLSKNFDPKKPETYANANQEFSMTLEKEGANFMVPVEINGSDLIDFAVMKGNMVLISTDGIKSLQASKRIIGSDIKGAKKISLPNGETVNGKAIIIRNLKVGRTNLKNVSAAVVPSLPSDYILGEDLFKEMGASLDPATGKLKFEPNLKSISDRVNVEDGGDSNNTNIGSGNKDALKDGALDGNDMVDKFVPDETWEALPISTQGSNKTISTMVNDGQAVSWTYNPASRKTIMTEDAVKALLDAGIIDKKDFLDGEKIKLSNGLKLRSKKFVIKKLMVGGYLLDNLTVEVSSKAEFNVLGRAFYRDFLPETHELDGKLYLKPKRRPRKR